MPSAEKAITILSKLHAELGSKYLAYWVLPNTVLTLSGARAYCDGVFWNNSNEQLKKWKAEIDDSLVLIRRSLPVVWSESRVQEVRPDELCAGYEIIFDQGLDYVLQNTQFIRSSVLSQLKEERDGKSIVKRLSVDLRTRNELKDYTDENLEDMAFGILVGYPDKAILGSVKKWSEEANFAEKLIDANIAGAGYYSCPQPVYSYPRYLINDPDITAHESQWSGILKDYYSSKFHKDLEKDSNFLKKMKELGNI